MGKRKARKAYKRLVFFFPLMTWDALRKHCTFVTMRHKEAKSGKEELTEI